MQEQSGAVYRADAFAGSECSPREVFAAPVFVPAEMTLDDLPLQDLYNRLDFVDLISAQEFGLEQTMHGKLLLCVVAAATPTALREMVDLLMPTPVLAPCAVCEEVDCALSIHTKDASFMIPASEQPNQFMALTHTKKLPVPAVLAALTTWCTGYTCRLYWDAA